jgi:hypothetical protein
MVRAYAPPSRHRLSTATALLSSIQQHVRCDGFVIVHRLIHTATALSSSIGLSTVTAVITIHQLATRDGFVIDPSAYHAGGFVIVNRLIPRRL